MYGWINIDKPCGISSASVVSRIKKILNVKKVGYAGTLDPLASGILPVAIGEATKLMPYAVNVNKSYLFTVQWGEQRTTDDVSGEVIKKSDMVPYLDDINRVIPSFIGVVEQVPPNFSAIYVNGVRAFELARSGQKFRLRSRYVNILDLKLLSFNRENKTADFYLLCKKGVYVRSIARDLGISLGCLGYVTKLRRVRVGYFKQRHAITLDKLKILHNSGNTHKYLLPLRYVLQDVKQLNDVLCNVEISKIKSGQNIQLNNLYMVKNCDICYVSTHSVPVAICSIINNVIKPVRVFNV
ncbi:tRNA pseudouridine(55) synthase TruB [Ehrlichia ruminantium]|uniref:tRNA pseudouridine synthase B n=1 Tax=Ehrlichia ruminantium TaxID=779 RepID=A0AAE6UIG3_EHRRU|nr:tRNA pseudouridine(55) synthase TruB [Ehrlichia ruminantium]QGR02423.1 tRNA pseudouridine(55) synthase TruB [Ehrlichia ruminantium]QGR03342.1 tRNA pseudouridine(55) synthase TruB [Ehrlichia ruminantium]QGR04269.1 tRNA pseudouridine(55) synthase TruB [Ehrlichia ruminantium]